MANQFKHTVNFYFESKPSLQDYSIAAETLDWINQCFDKNTNRVFSIGKIKKFKELPTYGNAYSLPAKKFDIDIYFSSKINDGYSLFNSKGTGIAVVEAKDLNPLSVLTKNIALHEIGHIFGVAIGEYYKSKLIIDFTMVEPSLRVSSLGNDDYWSLRQSWKNDIMLNTFSKNPKWGPLSALVINKGTWRMSGPPMPKLNPAIIKCEFKNTFVDIYKFSTSAGFDKLCSSSSDSNGYINFDWGCNGDEAISGDQMRKLIFLTNPKIARGISIFDLQLAELTNTVAVV